MTERNPADAHQTKIAKATLRMSDIGASFAHGLDGQRVMRVLMMGRHPS